MFKKFKYNIFLVIMLVLGLALTDIPMKVMATETGEKSESAEKPENTEKLKNTKETENLKEPEKPEDTEKLEDLEDTEKLEKKQEPEKPQEPEIEEPESGKVMDGEEESEEPKTQETKEAESGEVTETAKESEESKVPETEKSESDKVIETEKELEESKMKEPEKAESSEDVEIEKETENPKTQETEKSKSKASSKSDEYIYDMDDERESAVVETTVPIYNYEVVDIVAPATFAIALNPYRLPVRTGEDSVSTDQVVSRKYGLINKSSLDKIVTVTLVVQDLNDGKIQFVDSAKEAEEADADTYAIYLAAVPADDSGVRIGDESVDEDTTPEDLSDVTMIGAADRVVALREGENQISFRLSKAVYRFGDSDELILDTEDDSNGEDLLNLASLAPGGGGVTAFTFAGVMNPRADWGKLLKGVKLSAVYTYRTAFGDEEILEGTGAMVEIR